MSMCIFKGSIEIKEKRHCWNISRNSIKKVFTIFFFISFDEAQNRQRWARRRCQHANRRELPANTKHLYDICTTSAQRLRRWSNIVHMLYKCFVFTEIPRNVEVKFLDFPCKTARTRNKNRTSLKLFTLAFALVCFGNSLVYLISFALAFALALVCFEVEALGMIHWSWLCKHFYWAIGLAPSLDIIW